MSFLLVDQNIDDISKPAWDIIVTVSYDVHAIDRDPPVSVRGEKAFCLFECCL